ILFMLDGLDETEPELRDKYILPWLYELCRTYPKCHFLVSSRPQGYPPGTLLKLEFTESDLLDFEEPQVAEYTRHWCTAVRLARNEPEDEARREGAKDGQKIVKGFKAHPYIRSLARNPLMLSAICLVNYFEGGQLPEDRAVLYKLCVEGLLHHWDQRRGIHSEFTFNDKLRVCREVAVAMQADDKAEYELEKVQKLFKDILMDSNRSKRLLEHIRYRTGLLMERRPNVFAFAHLTFQEYLAARAVHEENRLGINRQRLVNEHDDGRWQEVIALYCGLANTPAARDMLEGLIAHPDTRSLSKVLAEAFFAAGPEITEDQVLRHQVIERIAIAPWFGDSLTRFPPGEVATIANRSIGRIESDFFLSESYRLLCDIPKFLDVNILTQKLQSWKKMNPIQLTELLILLHKSSSDNVLNEIAKKYEIYEAPGPKFQEGEQYGSQAEVALIGIKLRLDNLDKRLLPGEGFEMVLVKILNSLFNSSQIYDRFFFYRVNRILKKFLKIEWIPTKVITPLELAALVRKLAEKIKKTQAKEVGTHYKEDATNGLINWAKYFEGAAKGAVPGNKNKKR
ncbi:MAG: NACHT domain-containing protein, partial [Candidatus Aminicenantes bacterium]